MNAVKFCPIAVSLAVFPSLAGAVEKIQFNRDIRPILSKNCSACHGGVKEAGGVTVVFRDNLLKPAKSGETPIVPGHPEKSELFRRVTSKDGDEVMPPADHGGALKEPEIALLKQWITEGAEWQEHWAFSSPVPEPTPAVSNPAWVKQPLDSFVLANLDREKLKPSVEADASEWLRRVSFDLIGLPPSPEEVAALKAAPDQQAARAQIVDKLLASPSFGERWAPIWLDLARFADTTGFEKDPDRTIWPYRDWLIRAFNEDKPFDQFTIEQLAGDLLPNATADQVLATAFHRNTQTNTEGGTDDEEFRVAAVMDRTSTTWTAWQATTFMCVQCHSHPYDPIMHDEYFKFTAFFNNTEDTDLDSDFPKARIPNDPAKNAEAAALAREVREQRTALNQPGADGMTKAKWSPFQVEQYTPSNGKLLPQKDGTIRTEGTLPVGAEHVVSGPAVPFTAIRISILPESDDPKKWPERGSFVTSFVLNAVKPGGETRRIPLVAIYGDSISGPHDPTPNGNFGGYPKLHKPRQFALVPDQAFIPQDGEKLEFRMVQKADTVGGQATPVRRFRLETDNNTAWIDLNKSPERVLAQQKLAAAAKALAAIPGTDVPVMMDRRPSATRETRVFARGNRMSKEALVEPGVPALLAGDHKETKDRLAMARWLVDGKNPLTSRVMVNRLWNELFGIGIVETLEDFGTSGTAPSDQHLLDHLAVRFQNDHKWSVKKMLREIVLSATYSQTNKAAPELIERDPRNRLLARGPRVRLTAEMVRDQMLAVSGLLSKKMFGPPVFPPQPEGVWNTVYSGRRWNESKGEDRYRRALYTYVRRTSGFPGFLTFDGPARDLCSPRRINSNTPLQPLVTMNDPAHIEGALAFARRMSAAAATPRERLAHGYELALQRPASAATLDHLEALFRDAMEIYTKSPEDSAKIAPTPEESAMVIAANTILNLDAALNR